MKSVEWASEMLKISQRDGIWGKNWHSPNWSRFSVAEIRTSVDKVTQAFSSSPALLPAQITLKSLLNHPEHVRKTVKQINEHIYCTCTYLEHCIISHTSLLCKPYKLPVTLSEILFEIIAFLKEDLLSLHVKNHSLNT